MFNPDQVKKQENLDKKITEKYSYDFVLADDGLYLIEIIASAKSWRQNLKSFKSLFKDDDITLTLDRIEITTSMSNKIDVRPAWNGNELKGLFKTVVIAVRLKKGKHVLNFIPDQKPYLKSVIISQVEETNTLTYLPTENNQAEKGDRRPWLSFIIINLAVKDLTILAKADKRGRDDDDIKLIIDGEIQKNQDKKSHQGWYWCGKVLKGEKKEFKKTVNFNGGLHTIDLWADETPFLYKIELALNETFNKNARIPTVDDPEWTGNFNDDTEQMILARAIWGEARGASKLAKVAVGWSIKNRLGMRENWDNYHNIILDRDQYSCFWERSPRNMNLIALRNPAKSDNSANHEKWKEIYEIAGQTISRSIADPTDGANHYYDDSIKKKSKWMKEGRFRIKIDNLNFLYLAK